jgi:Protein of unknown function (DUF3592).
MNDQKTTLLFRRASVVVVIASALVVLFGFWTAFRTADFVRRAVEVDARVARIEYIDSQHGQTFRPTFTIPLPDGTEHESTTKVSATNWNYKVGQIVRVRYDPSEPAHALPVGILSTWATPLAAVVIGGVNLIGWIAALRFWIPKPERSIAGAHAGQPTPSTSL